MRGFQHSPSIPASKDDGEFRENRTTMDGKVDQRNVLNQLERRFSQLPAQEASRCLFPEHGIAPIVKGSCTHKEPVLIHLPSPAALS